MLISLDIQVILYPNQIFYFHKCARLSLPKTDTTTYSIPRFCFCFLLLFLPCNIDIPSIGWWSLCLLPVNLERTCVSLDQQGTMEVTLCAFETNLALLPCRLGTTVLGIEPLNYEEVMQLHRRVMCRCAPNVPH